MKRRLTISFLIGALSSLWCGAILTRNHQGAADFNVHPTSATPLVKTTSLRYADGTISASSCAIGLPFVAVRGEIAGALFFGISSGLLAFGLTRDGYTVC